METSFFIIIIALQLFYEIFQEIRRWDRIQRLFLHKKRITVEIELIHLYTRGRKTCNFNPFSSTSSEISPKILQCLINSPVRTHRRKPYSVPFRTVGFLFSDCKPYENKQACLAGGVGFHGWSLATLIFMNVRPRQWPKTQPFSFLKKRICTHILTLLSFSYATNALKSKNYSQKCLA